MADIQKVAQFVLRAKDEASPTLKAVGETIRRLSNIKVENQILALSNQTDKLKTSLAAAQKEAAEMGVALSRAKAQGAASAQAVSEYGQSLGVAQARARALKQALAEKTAQLHRVRDAAQSSFAAFSRGADALDVNANKQERLQRELNQTSAAYRKATADAARYLQAQRGAPGLTNQRRADAAIEEARNFKAAMREIQAEIARTNGAARGSFAAFDRVAVAMETQTTEALQLTPAIEQNTTNVAQNTAAQTRQRQAIDATTAAMRRQQTIAQRPVGRSFGGGLGGLADEANESYATRQGRGPLGLRPYELTNLGYQINDVVSGIAMGQPPMQIFAQQFGQIAQIFPAVTAGILKFLPVIGAFTVAVVAPIARINALNNSVEQFERQLAISADGALYSASRLGLMAQELDDLGVSVADARTAISTMIKAGVVESQIKSLVLAAEDLASATGQTVPEAAEKMANAFTGGFEGIQELDRELNFLTATQYEQIAAMFDAGDATGAYAATLSALEDRLDAVSSKSDGPWGQAISNIGEAWNNFMAYLADTTAIALVIRSIDALGIGLEKVTGLLIAATASENRATEEEQNARITQSYATVSDSQLDEQIADTRKALEKALAEREIGFKIDATFDTSIIDQQIEEIKQELAFLEGVRAASPADRASLNFAPLAPYEDSQPQKTAEEWAEQMDAVEAAHLKVNEATQEQQKAQFDVARSVEEMLEKKQEEIELAQMTAEEQFIQQGVLEAMNIAKERGVELDEQTLQNLRERLGLLYEMKNTEDAASFERDFTVSRFNGTGGREAELVAAAVEVAKQLGVSATDILTAISYETGGTLDPWQRGPTTQWGEHRGLIQWGEPQREQYGVTELSTIAEQMQAIARYLVDRGVQPGDGLLQIYAAINAGEASRINATDENNGGAPGTVAEKVNEQMEGHRARAEGLIAAYAGLADETERRVEKEKEGAEAFEERKADMEFELAQAGLAEREAAIAEAVRTAEKERGRALTAEERADIERLAAATYDAANGERLRGEEGKRLQEEINLLLERQAFLREQIAYAQQTGDTAAMSSAEAELVKVNEQLDAANAKSLAFWQSMGGPEAEAAILALQRTQFELGKLDTRFLMTGEQMNDFIANSATNAFTKFAEAIANGENAAKSLGDAFRQMAADILLRLGQMIVQQAIFNALSGMFGGGGGFGGFLMGTVGRLFHTGGVVGSGSGASRSIPSAVFAAAPRYHEGGIAGLKPGEVPAILKRGEEVLTEDDPRHVGNGGGAGGGTTIINAIDAPSFVEEALKSDRGRTPVLNFMRANAGAVRSALGV